jgi:hypothetical protein
MGLEVLNMSKQQVKVWLDPAALTYVRGRASAEKESVSGVVNQIVVLESCRVLSTADGLEVLLPALNAGVHQSLNRAVDGLNSRLLHLLERAVVNSLANRLAVFQLLAVEFGVEEATRIHEEASLEAMKRLKGSLEELQGAVSPAVVTGA